MASSFSIITKISVLAYFLFTSMLFYWNRHAAVVLIDWSVRFITINIFFGIIFSLAYQGVHRPLLRRSLYGVLGVVAVWINIWLATHTETVLLPDSSPSCYLLFFIFTLGMVLVGSLSSIFHRTDNNTATESLLRIPVLISLVTALFIALVATYTEQYGAVLNILNIPVSTFVYSTSVLLVFWLVLNNRVNLQTTEIKEMARKEEYDEEKEEQVVRLNHPRLSRLPLFSAFSVLFQKKNVGILFLFLLVLGVYTALRLPYFSQSFYIKFHPDKYVSYVPIAQEMYEAKNPFVFKNPAYTGLQEEIKDQHYTSFWRLPVLEWTLAPFFGLRAHFSDESIVRLYLTIAGFCFLFLFFAILRKIFTGYVALVVTFFLSITPVFNLLTWTTTLDLPAFIFFLSSIFLFINKRQELSYLVFGFAILTKLSFVIIGLPAIIIMIVLFSKSRIINLIKLGILSLAPLALFNVSIARTPENPNAFFLNIGLTTLFILLILITYRLTKRPISELLFWLEKRKRLWYFFLFFGIALFTLFVFTIFRAPFNSLASEFFTDPELIINPEFYTLLFDRIRFMSTPMLLTLFFVSFWTVHYLPRKKKSFLFTFLITSFIFFVAASKSIRFGWYYNQIFVLTMLLFIAGLFYQFQKNVFIHRNWKNILTCIFITFSFFQLELKPSYIFESRIDHQSLANISSLIGDNSGSDDKVLSYASEYRTLYLYTKRPILQLGSISNEVELKTLRQKIKENGFSSAMNELGITTMLDRKDEKNFSFLTYLFTEETDKISTDRGLRILSSLDNDINYYSERELYLYEYFNPSQYFEHLGSIQNVSIYKIVQSHSSD